MNVESVFIILLSVAMVVAILAQRFRVPYTVALEVGAFLINSTKYTIAQRNSAR